MNIQEYIQTLTPEEEQICRLLVLEIDQNLNNSESKIWHAHPVWFLNGNPIVGFSKMANGSIRLLFWSGQSFNENALKKTGSFKAADICYTTIDEINIRDLERWLSKATEIQWDYKNIVKRKGALERLK